MRRPIAASVLITLVLVTTGCLTVGRGAVAVKREVFLVRYETIRSLVIEAAALHGFPNFTSESRPSDLNGWKGDLYFSRETRAGVEQLFVEFAPSGDVVAVGLFAVASGSTSDQVIRAITDRLGGL